MNLERIYGALAMKMFCDLVAALGAIDYHCAGERILGQHLLRQGGERVCTFAEINWSRRQQDARSSRDIDHHGEANARTARNTAINWAASSMPDDTRTTAPASSTSIPQAQTPRVAPLPSE